MNVGLWIVQSLLAGLFMFSGAAKFFMPAEMMTKNSSLPLWFFYFIGICEILGGIGLLLPSALRIRPVLTPLAAFGLAIIMIGATVITMRGGQPWFLPALFFVLCVCVAYGRLRLAPIAPKTS